MKIRLAICLAIVAATPVFLPVTASAQVLLPPHEITTSVRSMGLQPITPPVLQGGRYVFRAVDRRGTEVKVAADGFSGRILFVEPLGTRPSRTYAGRDYPPAFPEETVPPGGGNNRSGGYQRQAPIDPGAPSVIYAPRDNAGAQNANPQPPARAPSAVKPVPKVAAKPAPKPVVPETSPVPVEASPPAEQSAATTGSTTATAPPAPPVEKNPALTAPPVQAFD